MTWTNYQKLFAVGMVVTGSINTLSTKWADKQSTAGCKNGNHPEEHPFEHPFLQAVGMFLGEFTCLIAFQILLASRKMRKKGIDDLGNQNFSVFLLVIPAMFDMVATCLVYLGLSFTNVASYQMLRGAVIVFTAFLSVIFIRSTITSKMWSGIACVVVGLVVVGLSDVLFPNSDSGTNGKYKIITGDLLIILAQIMTAGQMVSEEKLVRGRNIYSLQAIGWEGLFGMITLGTLLFPMYYIIVGHDDNGIPIRLEDAPDGFCQIKNSWKVALGTLGCVVSIAFFNFFGITITRQLSATTRMVLDSVRTIVIWAVSLSLQWQKFQYLQVVGFIILLFGTSLYNNLVKFDCYKTRYHPINVVNEDLLECDGDNGTVMPKNNEKGKEEE